MQPPKSDKQKLCQCGCGRIPNEGKRFVNSHNLKGRYVSPQTRHKISKANTGKKRSLESRKRMSEAQKGKEQSVEHRRKISEALKGKKRGSLSLEHRRKLSEAHKRENLSLEARRNLSQARIGKKLTPETRRKISEANKGRKLSLETRKKMSEAKKGRVPSNPFKKGSENPMYGKRGKSHPFYGEHHSPESRAKMSKVAKGRTFSLETRKKWSENRKGSNHPMYGRHHSLESRKKMSEARKGKKPWIYGRHRRPKTKKKLSEATKKLWRDPEFVRKVGRNRRPTSPEKRLMGIINEFGLPFKYVGDGQFIVGSRNPDFVDTLGLKKAIEYFGWYHRVLCKDHKFVRYLTVDELKETEQERKHEFAKQGWDCLIFWREDLRELDQIKNRIGSFVGDIS